MKQIYLIAASLLLSAAGRSQCTTPSVVAVADHSNPVCAQTSVQLSATSTAGQILWFDAATGGSQVGSGPNFSVPTLLVSTSYWAEAHVIALGAPVSGGAKAAPTSTGGTAVVAGTSPWGLAFTATQNFMLNSVDVFLSSSTPGNIVVQLKDSNYNLLQTVTVAAPAGGTGTSPVQFTVPLNLSITAGGSYKLVVASGSPAMIRDLGTNSFPYAIGSVGSITGGTINNANTNSGVYYFLYNWNFTPFQVCTSTRAEVAIDVISTPAPTGASNQTFNSGETLADLDVAGTNLIWYADATGTTVLSLSTVLTNGSSYWVSQTANGCEGPRLAVNVSAAMSVGEHDLQQMAFYPNPVSTTLTLSALEPINRVEVYSLQGQKLISRNFDTPSVQMNLSELASGTYVTKVYSGSTSRNLRIVKN